MPRTSHFSWYGHRSRTWWRVQIVKLLNIQMLPFQSPVTSSLLGPNIFLSTLFLTTVSICSSLNERDQVPHPYKTTDKIIVLCILTFVSLDCTHK
jgi:hypothetical protein